VALIDQDQSIVDTKAQLTRFVMTEGASLPAFQASKLADAVSRRSPVDTVIEATRALYAIWKEENGVKLSDEGSRLAAQCAWHILDGGFHNADAEAEALIRAVRKDAGEIKSLPTTMPAIAPGFASPSGDNSAPAPLVPTPAPLLSRRPTPRPRSRARPWMTIRRPASPKPNR